MRSQTIAVENLFIDLTKVKHKSIFEQENNAF